MYFDPFKDRKQEIDCTKEKVERKRDLKKKKKKKKSCLKKIERKKKKK